MIKIWSELRVARLKEQVADLATLVWVAFWLSIVWRLFVFLSSFAGAGRTIRSGGLTMVQGGRDLGDSLAGCRFATSPGTPSAAPAGHSPTSARSWSSSSSWLRSSSPSCSPS